MLPLNSAHLEAVRFSEGLSPAVIKKEDSFVESTVHLFPPSVRLSSTFQFPDATATSTSPVESVGSRCIEPSPSSEDKSSEMSPNASPE